jgi:hypothetical protein
VHGKGITLVTDWADYQVKVKEVAKKATWLNGPHGKREDIRDSCYLQRGICNCHLHEGRKYILRVYFLSLGDSRSFIYRDALGYGHAVPFDVNDKSWACHVSHCNVPGKDGKLAAQGGGAPKDERVYFTLREAFGADGDTIMENIIVHAQKHSVIFADTVKASQTHADPVKRITPNMYHVWGVDYMVMDDLNVTMIEVNAFPNLNHNNPRKGGSVNKNEIAFREAVSALSSLSFSRSVSVLSFVASHSAPRLFCGFSTSELNSIQKGRHERITKTSLVRDGRRSTFRISFVADVLCLLCCNACHSVCLCERAPPMCITFFRAGIAI